MIDASEGLRRMSFGFKLEWLACEDVRGAATKAFEDEGVAGPGMLTKLGPFSWRLRIACVATPVEAGSCPECAREDDLLEDGRRVDAVAVPLPLVDARRSSSSLSSWARSSLLREGLPLDGRSSDGCSLRRPEAIALLRVSNVCRRVSGIA